MQVGTLWYGQLNNALGKSHRDWRRHACLRVSRFLIAILGTLALISVGGIFTRVQAQSIEEHDAKAAFVLKVVNFVQWPPEGQRKELVVGFIGADATSEAFQRLASGKSVEGKSIVVRRLTQDGDLKSCNVVYVGSSAGKNIGTVLERLHGTSVLTVGESDGFGQHGGMINLLLNSGRIRFEVNPHAAERAHLQISSRLLSLATIVADRS